LTACAAAADDALVALARGMTVVSALAGVGVIEKWILSLVPHLEVKKLNVSPF
jgi:hypothetical protein